MKRQLQLQQEKQKEKQEMTIITDNIGDQSLLPPEDDFIPFSLSNLSDSEASDSDDSGLWESDKDYSWY